MIRNIEKTENLKINVVLKNGAVFLDRDITSSPFGENEQIVSFWSDDDVVVMYPIGDVEKIELFVGI